MLTWWRCPRPRSAISAHIGRRGLAPERPSVRARGGCGIAGEVQSQVCRCSEAAAPCDFLDRQFCCFEQPPLVETKAPDGPYFEAAIIHHTDCGSGLLADEKLRHGFAQRTRYDEETLADLPVLDPPETVRTDVERVLSDPRISPRITVSGHVYDVHTGLITTIVNPLSPTAAAAATS